MLELFLEFICYVGFVSCILICGSWFLYPAPPPARIYENHHDARNCPLCAASIRAENKHPIQDL